MKIGIVQSMVTDDKEKNLNYVLKKIDQMAQQGADLVLFGEMCLAPYDSARFPQYAEPAGGRCYQALSFAAKKNHIYLVVDGVPLAENGTICNAAFVFDRDGKELACCRKAHMFDINVEGGQRFFESETLTPGNEIVTFDTEFCKIGLCICFDFRFEEMARTMALRGAKVILVPAAFNMTTGPAHWELLFRQRAVDNQLFTVGAAPARNQTGYISYGNSIAVDPWGTVIYRADEKPTTALVDLDLTLIDKIRSQLPIITARRTDLY